MNIDEIVKIIEENELHLQDAFKAIDKTCFNNSLKVINSFNKENISSSDFLETTGYGYDDVGRDKIEKIFSDIFKSEDALVRTQFISGTHALTVSLFGLLRPNDLIVSVSGRPYDTLLEVIGIRDNDSSLRSFGIKYGEIDLINDDFDYSKIEKILKEKNVKIIYIQRSKGYSTRKSLTIDKIEKLAKFVKSIDDKVIIMVDNCYCEFVCEKEPIEVGVDVCIGSLIKNLGGGIAPNGAYVVGKANLVKLISERLTVPGEGKEVGPSLGLNKLILQGLFHAPSVVASALKTAILTSYTLEKLGFDVEPKYNDIRADIVQNVIFNDPEKLINYCKGIQLGSAIDSNVTTIPSKMPGYSDDIIMASGSFIQGSSIELSCDGPLRSPYIAYQQGALTYEYGKIGLIKAIETLKKNRK